jgi:hypothetical protein
MTALSKCGQQVIRSSRSVQQWKRRLERIMPRNKSNLVERINNRSFKLRHHLHVVDVLDVVALHDCDPSVDDHVLGMKRAEDWLVEVHDFDIDVGEVVWMGDANLAVRIRELVWLDRKVIVENLAWLDMSS